MLDGLETIRICVGYEVDGEPIMEFPVVEDCFVDCQPIYEDMPGWMTSTVGVTTYVDLPKNAQNYLARIEELAGVPLDIISTGPDREQTIMKRHPFD